MTKIKALKRKIKRQTKAIDKMVVRRKRTRKQLSRLLVKRRVGNPVLPPNLEQMVIDMIVQDLRRPPLGFISPFGYSPGFTMPPQSPDILDDSTLENDK